MLGGFGCDSSYSTHQVTQQLNVLGVSEDRALEGSQSCATSHSDTAADPKKEVCKLQGRGCLATKSLCESQDRFRNCGTRFSSFMSSPLHIAANALD
jgi:hypothetical protein